MAPSYCDPTMASSLFLLLLTAAICTRAQDPCFVPESSSEKQVNVAYFIWVGSEVQYGTGMRIEVANNSTFYHVMQKAEELYPDRYSFEAECTEWGHYITSIGGHHEDKEARNHWLIYKTAGIPETHDPPTADELTPFGVDKTYVSDNDYYLFWLRNTDFLIPPTTNASINI
ncbi:hypothetical protein C0J52_06242 [Blattella germanica]|nr:hypothetical protein C0J52_06242 [Blattella germanica]